MQVITEVLNPCANCTSSSGLPRTCGLAIGGDTLTQSSFSARIMSMNSNDFSLDKLGGLPGA